MIAELTIDLAAVRRNVARLAAFAAPARYAAVLKSNAYGHGLVEVARALAADVAAFCVYSVAEAATLRAAGIQTPLLVLGPVETRELELAHATRAAIALWSDGTFRRDVARVARLRGAAFAVHAKIDTGVARLGLDARSATAAAIATATLASYAVDADLDVRGIFTHLAAAEELASSYTAEQLGRFDAVVAPLQPVLAGRGVVRHAAASAAAMLFAESRLDLVRAGIATYGIWPSEATRDAMERDLCLEPALTWTTKLVVVREVAAGASVGYGCTFVTQRPSRIGVLPIGYADGLPRALSNSGFALVAERRVPMVGRVCMNMAFVDVTDVPHALTGARVTLLGRDGDATIDPNDLAAAAGTIGYELVARLPADVPRRYTANEAIASRRSRVPS